VKFKYEKDAKLFVHLKETLKDIVIDMAHWAEENGCPFVITATVSTLEEDIKLKRESSSHRDRRAIDISLNGWDDLQIKGFVGYYNVKFNHLGAVSKIDGKRRLVVFKKHGTADHLHIQIARGLE
jgi:hypothetical protein